MKWFDSFLALYPSITNDLHVSIATSHHEHVPFSGIIHHLSGLTQGAVCVCVCVLCHVSVCVCVRVSVCVCVFW